MQILHKSFFALLAGFVIILVALIIFVSPKVLYTSLPSVGGFESCDCFGSLFWHGGRCIGFPVDCSLVNGSVVSYPVSCQEPSCSQIFDEVQRSSFDSSHAESIIKEASEGTDALLVIDASNSMEGERLAAAKDAARRLVENIVFNERIGIIFFSEDALLAHNFSDDKSSLVAAIDSLEVMGGTKYLPALDLADEMFVAQSLSARKGVIFLSDGIPSDNHEAIVRKAHLMILDDISFFTINFGIEEEAGRSGLLQRMITLDDNNVQAKGWYRPFTDTNTLADAFYDAWQELRNADIIDIIPVTQRKVFGREELSNLGFRFRLDQVSLSGEYVAKSLCAPQLRAEAVFTNNESVSSIIALDASRDLFVVPQDAVAAGEYSVKINGLFESSGSSSCSFTGLEDFGNVTVLSQREACSSSSCSHIAGVLDDVALALSYGTFLPREGSDGRVVVLVDHSESMRSALPQAVRVTDRINRLLSGVDQRSLIAFSDDARLLVPSTGSKDKFSGELSSLVAVGTTELVPAFHKASLVLAKESFFRDSVVVLTDGFFYDSGGAASVLAAGKGLVDRGVCVQVIGFDTRLLVDEEVAKVFSALGKYSFDKLGCGGYVHSPSDEDLIRLVAGLRGGELGVSSGIRVVADIPQTVVFPHQLFIDARVISAQTGLLLPVISRDACLPQAFLGLQVFDGKRLLFEQEVVVDRSVNHFALPRLSPGQYIVRLNASMGGDCGFSDEVYSTITVLGDADQKDGFLFFIIIVVLLVCLVILGYFLRRKGEKDFLD